MPKDGKLESKSGVKGREGKVELGRVHRKAKTSLKVEESQKSRKEDKKK